MRRAALVVDGRSGLLTKFSALGGLAEALRFGYVLQPLQVFDLDVLAADFD